MCYVETKAEQYLIVEILMVSDVVQFMCWNVKVFPIRFWILSNFEFKWTMNIIFQVEI